ncbi:hypothetical protein T459_17835 [Capsicum annuum]|uniref:Uncharacterized protein n=1 Tax=Capsicum annuum TaxID=4072 RepID=A0A2G2ZCQ4_CAPAN|nr:hypothetical protein T459_17835 [Capsicum annuum]
MTFLVNPIKVDEASVKAQKGKQLVHKQLPFSFLLKSLSTLGKMHDKGKQVATTNKYLTKLLSNKVVIHMPQDEALLSTWKQELDHDVDTLRMKENFNSFQRLRLSEENFNSLQRDVELEGEFEKKLLSDVIAPSDIGVTFDDIGALENV